ncbi:MAG: long-chain fatty acid--CoA ligase [Deltaproteobacteria bacterium]|nr:long-chain fatty acid--CoA ligase [Deltaproteobacteria bacterium]MCB9488706.1 long-chain fatty acid--CoA ligase [Deltaproteobacteria bacterium]
MSSAPLPENSLAAIHWNRRHEDPERPLIISKRDDRGRMTDTFHKYSRKDCVQVYEYTAAALLKSGLKKGDHIAIFSGNRPAWISAASGAATTGCVITTVYPTLTAEEAGYILKHSNTKLVFVGDKDQLDKALHVKKDCPKLEHIVVLEPIDNDPKGRWINFVTFVEQGRDSYDEGKLFKRVESVGQDDVAALIYTSGTTGVPKGVMLTNANFLSQRPVQHLFDLSKEDIWLSHLPLCHSFGFVADYMGCLEVGGTMGMSEGIDPESMREALTTVRPTILMSVPRLYEKLYLRVQSILAGERITRQKLVWESHAVGLEVYKYRNEGKAVPKMLALKYAAASKILHIVKQQAGLDRVRVAYGGGGPLAKELMEFFNGLGIDIYQGYGLTETSPVATVTTPGNNKLGTVGEPIPGVEIKLDEDGEILIKGPNVMKGYYRDKKSTDEVMTEDGWFRSGDIGAFDEKGRLMITDRKKELIITSGGKNIAPNPIENAFNTDHLIETVILIGDNRNFLSALIAPDFDAMTKWAKRKKIHFADNADLIKKKEVVEHVQAAVDKVNKNLARFEQIKKFTLVDHEFSEANGVLTPSQKIKRRVVNEKYKDLIDAMYEGAMG